MKTKRKCPLCGKMDFLQKHHYIPQRIKKIEHFVYICSECHKKIHPENELILRIKYISDAYKTFKKFIKHTHPDIWQEWQPQRAEVKKRHKDFAKEISNVQEIEDD